MLTDSRHRKHTCNLDIREASSSISHLPADALTNNGAVGSGRVVLPVVLVKRACAQTHFKPTTAGRARQHTNIKMQNCMASHINSTIHVLFQFSTATLAYQGVGCMLPSNCS